MQLYHCGECKRLCPADEPGMTFEDVRSLDRFGRFIGATRVMTCGSCNAKKKRSVVVDTANKKAITKDQGRLF